jgi:hypothetical protein
MDGKETNTQMGLIQTKNKKNDLVMHYVANT